MLCYGRRLSRVRSLRSFFGQPFLRRRRLRSPGSSLSVLRYPSTLRMATAVAFAECGEAEKSFRRRPSPPCGTLRLSNVCASGRAIDSNGRSRPYHLACITSAQLLVPLALHGLLLRLARYMVGVTEPGSRTRSVRVTNGRSYVMLKRENSSGNDKRRSVSGTHSSFVPPHEVEEEVACQRSLVPVRAATTNSATVIIASP